MNNGLLTIGLAILLLTSLMAGLAEGRMSAIERSTFRKGAYYKTHQSENLTADRCRNHCKTAPRCKAFIFVKAGVLEAEPLCRLKEDFGEPTINRDRHSGIKVPNELIMSGSSGVDYPGNNYKNFAASSFQVCKNQCAIESDCLAWTYSKPSGESNNGRCYLKNGVEDQVLSDSKQSGVKGKENIPDKVRWVNSHNRYRKLHGSPEVQWSDAFARAAQAWADTCPSGHSPKPPRLVTTGENIAWQDYGDIEDAVEMWYSEEESYSYNNPPDPTDPESYFEDVGHFTQVVWKSTSEIGCGYAECSGNDAWVCQYNPTGNYLGQFEENVLPPR